MRAQSLRFDTRPRAGQHAELELTLAGGTIMGLLALAGMGVMGWNLWRTWQAAKDVPVVRVLAPDPASALA